MVFSLCFSVHFNDYIQNCGGTLIHPGGINGNEDLIYQVDADGMIVQTSTEGLLGSTTLKQNFRDMVGFCRHPIEQGQGGIVQDEILKGECDHHMTDPVSPKMIKQFGLPEEYKSLSKHSIIYGNSIDIFNQSHKKFDLKYLETPEGEVEAAMVFMHRLNMWSVFQDPDGGFEEEFCPTREQNGWVMYTLDQLTNDQELRDELWVIILAYTYNFSGCL